MTRKAWFADLLLLSAVSVWAITFVTVKDALTAADPLTFLALRFSLGAAAALLWARRHLGDRAVWRAGALLGVALFLGYWLQTWGLEHTTPSRSAFLTGLSVILVPFTSLMLFRRWPPVTAFAGAALATCGLWVLTGASFSGELPLGDLLTLGCTVAYALHITLTERYARHLPPMALVAVQLLVTAVLAAALAPLGPLRLHWSWAFAGAVALTGLVASTAAIGVQTWAQGRTTAVRAALIFSLEPVLASLYAAALGRETLTRSLALGGALIVLGVLVGEVGGAMLKRRATPSASAD